MLRRIPGLRLLVSLTVAGAAVLFLLSGAAQAATGTITRVAGTGTPGFSGDGGPASAAELAAPIGLLPTAGGGYYIADQGNSRIRYVGADGQITTIAGSGTEGFGGDGGPALAAKFDAPSALAALPDGSLLVADANNNRIRKISGGNVTTVVGNGSQGSTGDGGPATSAELRFPFDLAVAGDGSFYIADTDNNEIRKVSAAGIITTVAGTGTAGFSGDGGPATAAQLNSPEGVSIAPDGSLLIADRHNERIRRVSPSGTISTVAGNGIAGATGDGGAPLSAELNTPSRVTSLPDGGFLIADYNNNEIRRVDGGTITTVAGNGTAGATGDGGPATAAELNHPAAVALTPDNDYLVADLQNQEVRRVDAGDPTPQPPPAPSPTTTPATQPPPAPEGNLTPPQIVKLSSSPTDSYYGCRGDTWEGLPPSPSFTYTWYHVVTVPRFGPFGAPPQTFFTKVFSAPIGIYQLPDNLRGGQFQCRISVTSASGKPLSASSGVQTLTGLEKSPLDVPKIYGNFRINGIDVFQSVQPNADDKKFTFPVGYQGMCGGGTPTSWYPDSDLGCSLAHLGPAGAQQANYVGVRLDPDKPTTAVVYVDADHNVSEPDLPLTVTLHGVYKGRTLAGSVVQTIQNPPASSTDWVGSDERTSGRSRVVFTVPANWMKATEASGGLSLVATVRLPASATATYECNNNALLDAANCVGDDTFRLNGVTLSAGLPSLVVPTLELLSGGQKALNPPDQVERRVTDLYPGGELMTFVPYLSQIDISSAVGLKAGNSKCPKNADTRTCREAAVDADVRQWLSSTEFVGFSRGLLLAVHNYDEGDGGTEPGWSNSQVLGASDVHMVVNDGSAGRPLTAAGHEFGHILGAPHADLVCGGNSNKQVGESWAPDDRGRLQATAFGTYDAKGNRTQNVVTDTGKPERNDLMSYCASESTAWVSPFNWERYIGTMLAFEHPGAARDLASRDPAMASGVTAEARAAGAVQADAHGQAYVIGTLSSGGGSIDRVVPADPANHVPVSQPGSVVQVTAYGASGAPLAHTGAAVERLSNANQLILTFTAPLPAGTASVTATVNGQVVAHAARSRPPHVRLLSPRRGARVGGSARARLQVRWRAGDPDGDALQATVEYKPGGGSWRTVYMGPDRGHASIPGSLLPGSLNGRVRVTVNDGFNRARATSGVIRAAGQPPHVHITAPVASLRLQTGTSALLLGGATDDRGARVTGRRLTWFAGRRRLGSGSPLRVTLPAGGIVLRLVARDGRGRVTSVSRRISVQPVPLSLTLLSAPTFVRKGTKTLRLSLAATTAATVRAAGRSYAVGTKPRVLSVRLPKRPAHGQFAVGLVVTARGVHQRPVRTSVVVIRG